MTSPHKLTTSEWESLSGLVYDVTGIALSSHKKMLLVSRLGKRLKALNLSTFRDYYNQVVLNDPDGKERQELVNAITTNKTEFYRESPHFDVLRQWLSSHSPEALKARSRGLRIWCAASSTGQEPYTIADVVRSTLTPVEWDATQIFATDLDTNVLAKASLGIYSEDEVSMLPENVCRRMFLRGRGKHAGTYRIRPELRSRVSFSQLNLTKSGWLIRKPIDIIFCRNVLIYFDRTTQHEVVHRMCSLLEPQGLLFLGHSEGLAGMELPMETVAHTVYRSLGKCTSTERHSSGRVKTPEKPRAAGVASYRFDGGVFLFITVASPSSAYVFRMAGVGIDGQLGTLRSKLRSLRESCADGKICAKILYAQHARKSENPPEIIRRVIRELQSATVEITATRGVATPAEIRVEKDRARLFVRLACVESEHVLTEHPSHHQDSVRP